MLNIHCREVVLCCCSPYPSLTPAARSHAHLFQLTPLPTTLHREVVLFFTVYNEVASLYADVNAKKMGFTDIDGECRCGPRGKQLGLAATHATGHGLNKMVFTGIGDEAGSNDGLQCRPA